MWIKNQNIYLDDANNSKKGSKLVDNFRKKNINIA